LRKIRNQGKYNEEIINQVLENEKETFTRFESFEYINIEIGKKLLL